MKLSKEYQHIDVKAVDARKGLFEIFNKYYFKDLSDYDVRWSVYENGKEIQSGLVNSGAIPARTKAQVSVPVPFDKLKNDSEYFVKVQFLLKVNMPWAEKGFVVAEEQMLLQEATARPSISTVTASAGKVKLDNSDASIKAVSGDNFVAKFDMGTGTIIAWYTEARQL